MELTVDRLDGGVAALVDPEGHEVTVPLAWLPEGVQEGWQVSLIRQPEAEERLRDSIRAHQRRFHGGDIDL